MVSRWPLKPASSVRFAPSRPLALSSTGRALRSERRGSGIIPWRASQVYARVVKMDWHHATNVERKHMQVRVLSRVPFHGRVAQTYRASVSETEGRWLDSSRGHHFRGSPE